MFKVSKSQFEKFDQIIFEETRILVIQKLMTLREITLKESTNFFDIHRKTISHFGIITEAGMLRFLVLLHEYNISEEALKTKAITSIFTYPDREEELKIDKFHEYLIDLYDSKL